MITLHELAKRVNLSKSTVSKYINGGSLREKNRKIIEAAIQETGFRPNYIAKSLKTSKSYMVGVLVPFLTDIFASTIITVIEQRIKPLGYSVIVSSYQGNSEEFRDKINFLHDKMVDLIVVFSSGIAAEDFASEGRRNPPVLLIDKKIDGSKYPVVMIDNFEICYKACRYICQMGHRNIAIITGHHQSFTANKRVEGCIRAFEEFGITDKEYVVRFGDFSFENGYKSAQELLTGSPKVTAIFAVNYYLTNGVLKCINDLNLSVPEDISLVGFDSMEISNIYKVPLVLAAQPMHEIGEKSAEMIRQMLKNPEITPDDVILYGNIIEGKSVTRI